MQCSLIPSAVAVLAAVENDRESRQLAGAAGLQSSRASGRFLTYLDVCNRPKVALINEARTGSPIYQGQEKYVGEKKQ
jgi:hypothetical protein